MHFYSETGETVLKAEIGMILSGTYETTCHWTLIIFWQGHIKVKRLKMVVLIKTNFTELLKKKIEQIKIEMVKADVSPFLKNQKDLEIWSTDYFLQLADMIKFS